MRALGIICFVANCGAASHLITLLNPMCDSETNPPFLHFPLVHLISPWFTFPNPSQRSPPFSSYYIAVYYSYQKKGHLNLLLSLDKSASKNSACQYDVFLGRNWRNLCLSTKHPSDIRPPQETIPTDTRPGYPSRLVPVGRNDGDNCHI